MHAVAVLNRSCSTVATVVQGTTEGCLIHSSARASGLVEVIASVFIAVVLLILPLEAVGVANTHTSMLTSWLKVTVQGCEQLLRRGREPLAMATCVKGGLGMCIACYACYG